MHYTVNPMPRRNSKPPKHLPFNPPNNERAKTRYKNKKDAEKAAELQMLIVPGLELSVYQGLDLGWYLTRKQPK
jgi:hypothetical protein